MDQRKFIGIHSFGKVLKNAVRNEENFNSKNTLLVCVVTESTTLNENRHFLKFNQLHKTSQNVEPPGLSVEVPGLSVEPSGSEYVNDLQRNLTNENRSNVIPVFLGSLLSYPISWLHQEDGELVDRMQTLKINSNHE